MGELFHVHMMSRTENGFCIQLALVAVFCSATHLVQVFCRGRNFLSACSKGGDFTCSGAMSLRTLTLS